ncbi:MAG: hypothetical protein NC396_00715 [Bacteroides sp.]|nr:hypothetical protein [Bacteroides sp.]MCM1084843.1 hypothetical protein [Bacteroides sp.]
MTAALGNELWVTADRNGQRFAYKFNPDSHDSMCIAYPIEGEAENGTLQIGKPRQMSMDNLDIRNAQKYPVETLLQDLAKRQEQQNEAQDAATEQQEQQATRPDADARRTYIAGHDFEYTDTNDKLKMVSQGSRIVPTSSVPAGADPNTPVNVAITKPNSSAAVPGVMTLSEFQERVESGYMAAEEIAEADTAADVRTDSEGNVVEEEAAQEETPAEGRLGQEAEKADEMAQNAPLNGEETGEQAETEDVEQADNGADITAAARDLVDNHLLDIPYDSLRWNEQSGTAEPLSGNSKILNLAGRMVVVVDINGMHVPFYLSTGRGGKKTVESGKWYPFFGLSEGGWINKGSEAEINRYYGSDILKAIAEELDNRIGDVREDSGIPKGKASGQHIDFINRDLHPAENEMPTTIEDFQKNLSQALKDIESKFNGNAERVESEKEADNTSGLIGRSATEEEATEILSQMEADAEVAPEVELTPENWVAQFGEDGKVETPIGEVKMGENQLAKMFLRKRDKEFGMILPTLITPDLIIAEESTAKDGTEERPSSYLFVKTFLRDGKKVKYYSSVTVKKDGMEVVISNHYMEESALKGKLQNGEVLYAKEALLSNSSDGHLAEHQNGVPDLLPTQENNASSADKGTQSSEEKQVQLPENPVQKQYEALLADNEGDEADAVDTARQMVANTQAELEKARKATTNGKTVEAIQAAKRAKREKIAALEKDLTFWQDVAGYPEAKRGQEEQQRQLQRKMDARQRAEERRRRNGGLQLRLTERDKALGDPLSVEEYVLRRIATGSTKFLWNGTSDGTGGLKEHGGGNRYRLQYVDTNRGKVPEVVADDMVYDINENHPELGNVTASEILDIIEGIGVGEQGFSELMERAEELHNSNDYEAQAQAEVEEAEREERANDEAAQERARESVESLSEEEYHETIRPRFVGEMFEEDGTPRFDRGAGRAKANRKVYEFTRDLLRKAGIKVHEVSAEQAQAMANLGHRQEAARFHSVYHGTGAKFDAFDFSHMGEGEGAQAYGWGGYVTEMEGIGRGYAKRTAKIPEKRRENAIINGLARELLERNTKEEGLAYLRSLLNETWSDKKRIKAQIKILETGRFLPESKVNLYTVEIPDNTGENYLEWKNPVSKEQQGRIYKQLRDERITLGEGTADFWNGKSSAWNSGNSLYEYLSYCFLDPETNNNADKETSEFLSRAGFTGISYPAHETTGGRADGVRNYVIFKESDMKITDRVQFLQTPQGEVYGWTVGGEVFLNRDAMNPETPLHEYTHLWDDMVRRSNPDLWSRGVALMKKLPLWQEVLDDPNYADIAGDEDAVASEVHSRLTGERGAALIKEMMNKSDATLMEQLKAWLSEMFEAVKGSLAKWSGRDLSGLTAEKFADMTVRDLMEGVNPVEAQRTEEETIEREAKENGTWLKAPNGKPTKLTPKQWVQVRTKAFKDWFGDWELANLYGRATEAWNNKDSKGKVVFGLSERAKNRFNELLGTDIKQLIITDDSIRHIKNNHGANESQRGQKDITPDDVVVIPYLVNNFDSMELSPKHNDAQGNRGIEIRKRINGVSVIATIEKGKNKEFLVTNYQFVKSDALDASKETPGPNVRNDSDIAKVRQEIEKIKEQAKNASKVVDENGEPMVLQHGTPVEGLSVFDVSHSGENTGDMGVYGAGFYFEKKDSEYPDFSRYGDNIYDVFLKLKKPRRIDTNGDFLDLLMQFDTPQVRKIGFKGLEGRKSTVGDLIDAVKEVRNAYENGEYDELIGDLKRTFGRSATKQAIFSNIYLKGYTFPSSINTFINDCLDSKELSDAFKEEGYDGIDVDEMREVAAFSPNQIKSATDNVGTFDAGNEDIRFRMAEPTEQQGELVAVHNLSEDKLKEALDLGGFPMPSIAITKGDMGHTEFGDISLVFGRESIDPADRQNKVYGEDAWTPTFPQIGIKIDDNVLERIEDRVRLLVGDALFDELKNVIFYPTNVETGIDRRSGRVDYGMAAEPLFKLAYLKDAHPETTVQGADTKEIREKVNGLVDSNNADYRKWLDTLFDGIVEKRGIRNTKDMFTPMGNRRSFEALYDEITLDNVVKSMKRLAAKGGEGIFNSSIFGAAQKDFKSIEQIRKAARERIRQMNQEEYDSGREAIKDRLSKIVVPGMGEKVSDVFDWIGNVIDAVAKSHAPQGIYNYLKGFYPGMTMEAAKEIADVVKDIQKMSARYFEAKPRRAVGIREVKFAVVPEGTDAEIIKRLERYGIPVKTYEKGNEARRVQLVNEESAKAGTRFRFAGEMFDEEGNPKQRQSSAQSAVPSSRASRAAKRAAAEELGRRLGVRVVVEDSTTPKGRSRRFAGIQGWFVLPNAKNPDGAVHVNVDNHASVEDVERSIAHEVVAHLGMRKLMGEEKYNALLDKVHASMTEEQRAYFEAYAAQEFSRREGMTEAEYRAELRRVAADEYIASLAEVGTDPTTWQRVVALVREALRAVGFNFSLSDADIRALLYESRHNLESAAYYAEREMFRQRQEEFRAAAELDRRIREDEGEDIRFRRNLTGTAEDKRLGVISLTPDGATRRQKRHNAATAAGQILLDDSLPVKNLTNHLRRAGGRVTSDTDLWERRTTVSSRAIDKIHFFRESKE